ncbi:MAG: GWxTD domain-containing protein [Bacteroidota bacterium]
MVQVTGRRTYAGLALVTLLMLLVGPAQARLLVAPDTTLEGAIAAYEQGAYAEAEAMLSPLVEENPAYLDPREGAAAYWLGLVHEARGNAERMRQVWQKGLNELIQDGRFDVRLADAYLEVLTVAGEVEYLDEAVDIYRTLLFTLDAGLASEAREVFDAHLGFLSLVVDDEVWAEAVEVPSGSRPSAWTVKAGAGPKLVEWWRAQDPLPATRRNERLEEHLSRVAHARANYGCATECASGLDARGEVYVRYGEPEWETAVSWNSAEIADLFRPGVAINLSDFPDNAFWRYGDLDRAAYFVFVDDGGTWKVGTVEDLIPETLRYGLTETGRGRTKSEMLITILFVIYRELGPLHPDFTSRYGAVASYIDKYQQSETRDPRTGQAWGMMSDLTEPPHVFGQQFLLRNRTEDDEARYRRTLYVPEQASAVLRDAEVLPLAVRTARFLADDGTTRTEIYWSPEPGSLTPSRRQRQRLRAEGSPDQGRYVLRQTTVQKNADYVDRVVSRDHFYVEGLERRGANAIPVQTVVARGDTGRYHLAMQWDQYQAGRARDQVQLGERIKVGTYRLDSLSALPSDPATLILSDLRPEFVLRDQNGEPRFDAAPTPYPFGTITPELALALYFEVYHLTRGPDDLARYTVDYEITRRGTSELLRFLGMGGEERTASQTSYTHDGRTARETIFVDMSDWRGQGEVTITVRVTDETTGQQTSRSIDFELDT